MIKVTIYRKQKFGFTVEGHANYSKRGSDIVCSAVTIVVFNTLNSLEAFTKQEFVADQSKGYVSCFFAGETQKEAKLLFDSMLLGLKYIEKNYRKYISIIDKEVCSDV